MSGQIRRYLWQDLVCPHYHFPIVRTIFVTIRFIYLIELRRPLLITTVFNPHRALSALCHQTCAVNTYRRHEAAYPGFFTIIRHHVPCVWRCNPQWYLFHIMIRQQDSLPLGLPDRVIQIASKQSMWVCLSWSVLPSHPLPPRSTPFRRNSDSRTPHLRNLVS